MSAIPFKAKRVWSGVNQLLLFSTRTANSEKSFSLNALIFFPNRLNDSILSSSVILSFQLLRKGIDLKERQQLKFFLVGVAFIKGIPGSYFMGAARMSNSQFGSGKIETV